MFQRCCHRLKFNENEWHFLKAHNRLQNELDIKQFIRNIRTLRNSLKFLTTRRERNLVKMQADKNASNLNQKP